MTPRRISLFVVAGIWLGMHVCIAADGLRDRRVQSFQNSDPVQIAILGAVAKPGVYEWTTQQGISAEQVIATAGGTRTDATGMLHIVRHGRSGLRTVLGQAQATPLEGGDVVIVEAAPAMTAMMAQRDPVGRVHVAIVNLLPAPVILTLSPEDAWLSSVKKLTGQQEQQQLRAEVISPRIVPKRDTEEAPIDVALMDGSVVVYAEETVSRETVPTLPGPLNRPSGKKLTKGTSSTAALPAPAALPGAPGRYQRQRSQVSADVEPPSASLPSPNAGPSLISPTAGEEVDDYTAEPVPFPVSEPVLQDKLPPPPPLEDALPKTAVILRKTGSDLRARPPRQLETNKPVIETSPGNSFFSSSLWIVWGSLGMLSVLSLAAYRAKRTLPLTMPQVPLTATQPAMAGDLLADLVQNRLPLIEEPVEFPMGLSYQGRPRQGMQPRLDTAHPQGISGEPHIVPEPVARAAPHFAVPVNRHPPVAAPVATPQPHRTPRQPTGEPVMSAGFAADDTGNAGLLDRVLTNVRRNRR